MSIQSKNFPFILTITQYQKIVGTFVKNDFVENTSSFYDK